MSFTEQSGFYSINVVENDDNKFINVFEINNKNGFKCPYLELN